MHRLILGFILVPWISTPVRAQYGFLSEGFGRAQLIKFTESWKGPRFDDGRPKVSDELLNRLRDLSSEEAAWGPTRRAGYLHQWEGNWLILNPQKRLVGRAFTCVFMPGRPDVSAVTERDARNKNLVQHNIRVMDLLQPGDVLVADMGGKVADSVVAGDNLAVAVFQRTGNGFVVDGGIRDRDGIEPEGYPVYARGTHPSIFGDLMLAGVNIPVRIGDVTVVPGDVIVGDTEGVSVVPPHLAQMLADKAELIRVIDDWRKSIFKTPGNKYKPGEVYGTYSMQNPVLQRQCEVVKKHYGTRIIPWGTMFHETCRPPIPAAKKQP